MVVLAESRTSLELNGQTFSDLPKPVTLYVFERSLIMILQTLIKDKTDFFPGNKQWDQALAPLEIKFY